MTIHHETEPAQDHPVELSLEYALSDPNALIGVSPDQRYEEMRRQLLAGPLKAANENTSPSNAETAQVNANMDGDHHFNPETGEISGSIKLTGLIQIHEHMTPDQMLAAARPHFANALAKDINAGLVNNLRQHEAQKG